MPEAKRERREKRFTIANGLMEEILSQLAKPTQFMSLPKLDFLPTGWQLERVQYSFNSNSFELVASHESFDVVPDGEETPRHNEPIRWLEFERINKLFTTHCVAAAIRAPLLRIAELVANCPEHNCEWMLSRLAYSVKLYEGLADLAATTPRIPFTPCPEDASPAGVVTNDVAAHLEFYERNPPLFCLDTETNDVSVVPPTNPVVACPAIAAVKRRQSMMRAAIYFTQYGTGPKKDHFELSVDFRGRHRISPPIPLAATLEEVDAALDIIFAPMTLANIRKGMGLLEMELGQSPIAAVCTDCNGTGQYIGLNVVEPCKTCQPGMKAK